MCLSAAVKAEQVQKKVFTRWINATLKRSSAVNKAAAATVEDLYTDLADGQTLLQLLDVLTDGQASTEMVSGG
jgi:Calponin homology (CH) domain